MIRRREWSKVTYAHFVKSAVCLAVLFTLASAAINSAIAEQIVRYGPFVEGQTYQDENRVAALGRCNIGYPYFSFKYGNITNVTGINKSESEIAPDAKELPPATGAANNGSDYKRYRFSYQKGSNLLFTRNLEYFGEGKPVLSSFGGQIGDNIEAQTIIKQGSDGSALRSIHEQRRFVPCVSREEAIEEVRYPLATFYLKPLNSWVRSCRVADATIPCTYTREYEDSSTAKLRYKILVTQHGNPEPWVYDLAFSYAETMRIRGVLALLSTSREMKPLGCSDGVCTVTLQDVRNTVSVLQGGGPAFNLFYRAPLNVGEGRHRPIQFLINFESGVPLKDLMGPLALKPPSADEAEKLRLMAARNASEGQRIRSQYAEAYVFFKEKGDANCLIPIAKTIEQAEADGGNLYAYVTGQADQNSAWCYAHYLDAAGKP